MVVGVASSVEVEDNSKVWRLRELFYTILDMNIFSSLQTFHWCRNANLPAVDWSECHHVSEIPAILYLHLLPYWHPV